MSEEPTLNFDINLNEEKTVEITTTPSTTSTPSTHNNSTNPPLVDDPTTDTEAEEDAKLLKKTIAAFKSYQVHVVQILKKKLEHSNLLFDSKPLQQSSLKPIYLNKLAKVGFALKTNALFLNELVKEIDLFNMNLKDKKGSVPSLEDMDRVNTTLKQLMRDWSAEGEYERSCAYKPLVAELERKFKDIMVEDRYNLKVLVPGAGLGRLAFDISSLGFSCQGNEFSYFMLLASNFILNQSSQLEQYTIHPYASNFSNNLNLNDQLTTCKIPDQLPRLTNPKIEFSMVAGEFLEVYNENSKQHSSWDSVVTCFFIDTAHNIADYVDAIWNLLKPGSPWINLGPLLYHYEGVSGQLSLELTYQELKFYIQKVGFKIENEIPSTCPYTANMNSLHVHKFKCMQFTAVKPLQ